MASPKYQTPEYRAAYKQLKQDQAQGKWLMCVQGWHGSSGDCLFASRSIAPTAPAHVAHDDSGTRIIGVAHARCNTVDGGRRRHAKVKASSRWIL